MKLRQYLEEKAQVRKFKDVKAIADFIMHMEDNVKDKDAKKFDAQLNRVLDKEGIDPENEMSAHEAIQELSFKKAKTLYASLTGFSYEDLDEATLPNKLGKGLPDIDQRIWKGKDGASQFEPILVNIKRSMRGDVELLAYKIKGDTIVLDFEDASQQKEEYYTVTLKVIKTEIYGG